MAEATQKTAVQVLAERQALLALRELRNYQQLLPANDRLMGSLRVCRADGWAVCNEFWDDDFDLDEPLARCLVANVLLSPNTDLLNRLGGSGHYISATPSKPAMASSAPKVSWLDHYLFSDPAGDILSVERFESESSNSTLGPGNIMANANSLRNYANVVLHNNTSSAILAASRRIESSGARRSIRINQNISLYNANDRTTGRPRPRLRINGLPMQVVTSTLGESVRSGQLGMSTKMTSDMALKAGKMGKLAAQSHWTGKAAFLNRGLAACRA